jgi:valyl-tRNA synthetase
MIKLLEKNTIEIIDIFNEDATMNSFGLHYQGKDRFVREEIAKELKLLVLWQNRNTLNKVGTLKELKQLSEPRLSDQWFLKMEDLVKPIISFRMMNKLHPKRFENTYAHWLNNIRDWNISRQLWGNKFLLISTEMEKDFGC